MLCFCDEVSTSLIGLIGQTASLHALPTLLTTLILCSSDLICCLDYQYLVFTVNLMGYTVFSPLDASCIPLGKWLWSRDMSVRDEIYQSKQQSDQSRIQLAWFELHNYRSKELEMFVICFCPRAARKYHYFKFLTNSSSSRCCDMGLL